jgi:SAM-dependent methyltransferase
MTLELRDTLPHLMADHYRDDLAHIHDAGFGQLAAAAAAVLIEALHRRGLRRGTIVELGCGSGLAARLFCDAGFEVVGIDLSPSLIEMARKRVPEADFRVESIFGVAIPPSVAVAAFGEVLNYSFDAGHNDPARAELLRRIGAALEPAGVLLFDVAGPDRAPTSAPQLTFTEGADWAVLLEAEADSARRILTRRITTFCRQGELYRRDLEIHRLELFAPAVIVEGLRRAGMAVESSDRYGEYVLPSGLTVFLSTKVGGGG